MEFLKTIFSLFVAIILVGGIWIIAVVSGGKNETRYECVVKQEVAGYDAKKTGRIFLGVDEYKWWASIFRWDRPFDVTLESNDFSISSFYYGKTSINKEISLASVLGEKYEGRLSRLSGHMTLKYGEQVSFEGTCKKI